MRQNLKRLQNETVVLCSPTTWLYSQEATNVPAKPPGDNLYVVQVSTCVYGCCFVLSSTNARIKYTRLYSLLFSDSTTSWRPFHNMFVKNYVIILTAAQYLIVWVGQTLLTSPMMVISDSFLG